MMHFVHRKFLLALGVIGGLLLAAPATAHAGSITLTQPGTFTVLFGGNVSGTNVGGLTSQATVHFLGYSTTASGDTEAMFDISLTNTTDSSRNPALTSRVSAFGFDVDPDATGGTVSGVFTKMILGGSLPNQFGPIEVCVNDGGGSSCQGGGGGGIAKGDTETFLLTLQFAGAVDTLTLDNFGVRYQSIDGKSIDGTRFNGASGTGTGTPGTFTPDTPNNVPEPAAILLFGVGLSAAAFKLRRRRRRAQTDQH
jgi:hypothetical protein